MNRWVGGGFMGFEGVADVDVSFFGGISVLGIYQVSKQVIY
jgi:hypothetical protein